MSSSVTLNELVLAIRWGQMQEVQRLWHLALSNGVNVNSTWECDCDCTPLTIACLYRSLAMVRSLIEEGGADVNKRNPDTHHIRDLEAATLRHLATPLHAVVCSYVNRHQKV